MTRMAAVYTCCGEQQANKKILRQRSFLGKLCDENAGGARVVDDQVRDCGTAGRAGGCRCGRTGRGGLGFGGCGVGGFGRAGSFGICYSPGRSPHNRADAQVLAAYMICQYAQRTWQLAADSP
jgi:hypothetical protein